MVQGNLMPRPASILSSVITVTFIGQGRITVEKLRKLFHVRRHIVFEALVWLKRHNPKYYADINIDSERLNQLPEDDVPIKISAVVQQTTDEGLVDQESSGYVPIPGPSSRTILGDADEGKYFLCYLQSII